MFAAILVSIALLSGGLIAEAAEIARFEPRTPPPLSADAVLVTDTTSKTDLYALNADAPLPPASLTKIVAALVILDRADLDAKIEIMAEDIVSAEESQVGLVAGDRLTVRDLLMGALIPSGNDATLALARHVGSLSLESQATANDAVAEFVGLMNEKAQQLGATNSTFKNPTGIDAEGHAMSARDIATVTAAALGNPLFAEIVATPSAVLASEVRPEGYAVETTNQLLVDGEVTGVKTGTTAKAGGCLVTSFAIGPNNVVAVVLGSELRQMPDGGQDNSARYTDTRSLLASLESEYLWLNPADPATVAGLQDELQVWNVVLRDGALVPVPMTQAGEIRYRLILGPPGSPDAAAGAVQFFVGSQLVSEQTAVQALDG